MVINLLANNLKDVESLRSASLVCKAWHEKCCPHLFRSVDLKSRAVQIRFHDIFKDDAARVARHVRVLSIAYARYGRLEALVKMLELFTNVQVLNIGPVILPEMRGHTRELLGRAFPSITEIYLHNVTFKGSKEFITFLNAKPLLNRLTLRNVNIRDTADLPRFDRLTLPRSQLRVATLVLDGCYPSLAYCASSVYHCLRSLTIGGIYWTSVEFLNQILHHCTALTELCFKDCLDYEEAPTIVDLQNNTALKIIRFLPDEYWTVDTINGQSASEVLRYPLLHEDLTGRLSFYLRDAPTADLGVIVVDFKARLGALDPDEGTMKRMLMTGLRETGHWVTMEYEEDELGERYVAY